MIVLNIPESINLVSLPVNADMGSGSFTAMVDLHVDNWLASKLCLEKIGFHIIGSISFGRCHNFHFF